MRESWKAAQGQVERVGAVKEQKREADVDGVTQRAQPTEHNGHQRGEKGVVSDVTAVDTTYIGGAF